MKRKIKRHQLPRNGIQYITSQDVREELNPFVFFDAGTMRRSDDGMRIGMHPHSGIGIITYFEGAELVHDDTGNNDEVIRDGGIQWIRAGGGVWHEENYGKKATEKAPTWPLTIHQLWMQLPEELEEAEVEYQNIQPEQLPVVGNVKVIAGEYDGVRSPLEVPYNMTYLDVRLSESETFTFSTPQGQLKGFVFPRSGDIELDGGKLPGNQISILEENEGDIVITASEDSKFVILMAQPQHTSIVAQGGSIHTNVEALNRSFERIQQIGMEKNLIR